MIFFRLSICRDSDSSSLWFAFGKPGKPHQAGYSQAASIAKMDVTNSEVLRVTKAYRAFEGGAVALRVGVDAQLHHKSQRWADHGETMGEVW